jgi:hypothetical protein
MRDDQINDSEGYFESIGRFSKVPGHWLMLNKEAPKSRGNFFNPKCNHTQIRCSQFCIQSIRRIVCNHSSICYNLWVITFIDLSSVFLCY